MIEHGTSNSFLIEHNNTIPKVYITEFYNFAVDKDVTIH